MLIQRVLRWASGLLLLAAIAAWGAYAAIGSEVGADGVLREPFALIPLGWLCLIAGFVLGVVCFVRGLVGHVMQIRSIDSRTNG